MAENTFLGLQPYTEADAYRFKGRTEESQELFRLIVRNDYTVCYAESGEGKTSTNIVEVACATALCFCKGFTEVYIV